MTLGEQIRAAREQKNLSQEELAEYMGVSRQAVSKWENGASVPHGANRSKLAEFLGLEPEPPEAPGKKPGVFPWIGWVLVAALLLILAGVLIYRKSAPSDGLDEPPMTSDNEDAAARRLVAEDCVYTVLDQYHNYVPVTVSASEFQALLDERSSLSSGIPYALTIAEDQIVEIREQYIP